MDNRNKHLSLLVRHLLNERKEFTGYNMPATLQDKQYALRALLNVRPPEPIEKETLALQNEELQAQLKEKGVVSLDEIAPCASDARLRVWQGDITRLKVDSIVNAANSALLGCFVPHHRCIDNAIHSAAGIQLRLYCKQLMEEQGTPEPTDKAKITPGFNLPARFVLHTVGPIVKNHEPNQQQCEDLTSCYHECLALADLNGLQSIAFCCISTGEFGFPGDPAARIAVETVKEYLDTTPQTHLRTVIFNVFKDCDYDIYQALL